MKEISLAVPSISDRELDLLELTAQSGTLSRGPMLDLFEVLIGDQVGATAVGVSSGTAALHLALLLHRPDVAAAVRAESLRDLPGPDIDLLRQLLEHLQRRPESSTAALLGHWYGTEEGELMSRLASQERLIPSEGIEQQFVDTVSMLSRRTTSADLAASFDKLRGTNYADLSELEKLQLKEKLSQLKELKNPSRGPTE